MRRLITSDRRSQRGATITVVTLILTVLVSIAALVVDLGMLYQERRELQNGADAGALAVAALTRRSIPRRSQR